MTVPFDLLHKCRRGQQTTIRIHHQCQRSPFYNPCEPTCRNGAGSYAIVEDDQQCACCLLWPRICSQNAYAIVMWKCVFFSLPPVTPTAGHPLAGTPKDLGHAGHRGLVPYEEPSKDTLVPLSVVIPLLRCGFYWKEDLCKKCPNDVCYYYN